jgi:hypothetical protein
MKPWVLERDLLVEQTLAFVESAAATVPARREVPILTVAAKRVAPPKLVEDTMPSERADILRRVAAFRAHQAKIRQDREKYCNEMLAKTRAALRNGAGRL